MLLAMQGRKTLGFAACFKYWLGFLVGCFMRLGKEMLTTAVSPLSEEQPILQRDLLAAVHLL